MQSVQKFVVGSSKTPMFELYKDRPLHWPPNDSYTGQTTSATGKCLTSGSLTYSHVYRITRYD